MNRGTFGAWGAGLHSDQFAAALAAVGVSAGLSGSTALDAVDRAWGAPAMHWRLPRDGEAVADAEPLARLWGANRRAWQERTPVLRDDPAALAATLPRMAVDWSGDDDPTWVVSRLGADVVGPLSLHVSIEPRAGRVRWSWPLQIGLLDDPQSEHLRRRLSSDDWFWRPFATPRTIGAAGGVCDLLLLPEPLRLGAGRVLHSAARASCVVALRPPTDPWAVTFPLIRALGSHVGAAGIAFAAVAPPRTFEWLDALLRALAYDQPLDVALRLAAMRARAAAPLLFAADALLEETRLSRVAQRLDAGTGRSATRRHVLLREGASEYAAPSLRFDSELHGARELALRTHVTMLEPGPQRFIQCRLLTETREPLTTPLQPLGDYALSVRVGPQEDGWASASGDEFPTPQASGPHLLTVVLSAPDLLSEPATGEIWLPDGGASSTWQFAVHLPADCTRLRARIIVLHDNRVLQTATLDAAVGDAGTGAPRLDMATEAAVRLRLDDLDSRRPFDAALLVDDDEHAAAGLTTVAGGRARVLVPHEFQTAVDRLRDCLEDAVLEPAGYDRLDDASLDLIRALANQGSALYEAFMRNDGAQSVVDAERLQLVALRQGADFPLEFVYERIAPEPDASLCPQAAEALVLGSCPAGGCSPPDDASVVCPLAFWGLTKSIERHLAHKIESYELEVLAEPTRERSRLGPTSGALFAASSRVADDDLERLRGALTAVTGGNVGHASSWEQWRASVAADHPPILVVLPHTLAHPQFRVPAMEIGGTAKPLAQTNIRADVICPTRAHHPLVILLGCNTAATDVPLYDLAAKFRSEGAAVVLGTVTKVLGRHAATVAARIVTELARRAGSGEAYVTDVVRDVRRALLAEGLALGMAVVAYCDGDWTIGGE